MSGNKKKKGGKTKRGDVALDHDDDDTKARTVKAAAAAAAAVSTGGAVGDASVAGEAGAAAADDDEMYDFLNYGAEEKDPALAGQKELPIVDHSKMDYEPFEKDFYVEVPEIRNMSDDDVADYRRTELDGIVIRGGKKKGAKPCPRPVKKFSQCGLPLKVLKLLESMKFTTPTPIQAQAIPAVMSGRDVIGIAATGSGKTLAFLLPMFRHILAQRPLSIGEGPIGLILCPTRELALQTTAEAKKFQAATNLRCVAVYGGAPMVTQIGRLKRGAEIVVATPGRMIDLLCCNQGRLTNLTRVTMVVLDEADRMFDMGFQPQIERIVRNIRPSRQTMMFSATFPRTIEASARKVLQAPVEITVGGRTRVASTVIQHVEIMPEADKFDRLVQLIRQQQQTGSPTTLVFVDRKEAADQLVARLLIVGVRAKPLHSAIEQVERDFTLDDFKRAEFPVLVATSVAARGLDVPHLNLVINFDAPNHLEDYVQRCGRTGRAGRSGTAHTFLVHDEAQFAPDIVRALKDSQASIPQGLVMLAEDYARRRAAGEVVATHGSGFGGKGFGFDASDNKQIAEERRAMRRAAGIDAEDEEEVDPDADPNASLLSSVAPGDESQAAKEARAQRDVADALAAMRAMEAAKKQAQQLATMKTAIAPPVAITAAPTTTTPTSATASMSTTAALIASITGSTVSSIVVDTSSTTTTTTTTTTSTTTSTMPTMSSALVVPDPSGLTPDQLAARAAAAAALRRVQARSGGVDLSSKPKVTPIILPGMVGTVGMAPNWGIGGPLASVPVPPQMAGNEAAQRAAMFAAALNMKASRIVAKQAMAAASGPTSAEFEINDYIQHARWKVTQRETIALINETTGCSITTRGMHIGPGTVAGPLDRKLHLHIEGPSPQAVDNCKIELKRIIDDATANVRPDGGGGGGGGGGARSYAKYKV